MSSEPFVGTIGIFGGNFAPLGWQVCDGSLLSISEYQVLYTLIGTTYGGNGTTTFAVPDLRGATCVGQGTLAGGSTYVMGQKAGGTSLTMTANNMPSHTHVISAGQIGANSSTSNSANAANNFPALADTGNVYAASASQNTFMAPGSITTTPIGSNIPFDITNPFLTMTYCIAYEGIFPTQN